MYVEKPNRENCMGKISTVGHATVCFGSRTSESRAPFMAFAGPSMVEGGSRDLVDGVRHRGLRHDPVHGHREYADEALRVLSSAQQEHHIDVPMTPQTSGTHAARTVLRFW